jgi:hypothetical protein
MSQTSPVTESAPLAWRYEIQHGPDGETDYAWVYDLGNNLVCTTKTRHAIAIVDAMRGHAQCPQEPTLLRQAEDCLKDWLNYADAHLSEFDVEDGDCHEEKLCPKCEGSGCIQYKIRETRHALAALAVSSTGREAKCAWPDCDQPSGHDFCYGHCLNNARHPAADTSDRNSK